MPDVNLTVSLADAAKVPDFFGLYHQRLAALQQVIDHLQTLLTAERAMRATTSQPLAALGAEILEINRANGWHVATPDDLRDTSPYFPYKIPTALALITSEVSEALEAYRRMEHDHLAEELADILIRTLDLGCGLGFDLDAAVRAKLATNRGRGHKYGGKVV